ncbi:nucleotidyltransferase domain-containing protein [Chryseobacterium taklimakanense]|uniref:nucleotidyltransferase family protein n=1 Tax=Chryseobacterium taklimakanense TaxID=536441 RepID=UPI001EF65BED|nr:nucleotidyltransferase domain-containing protein [Chryseobacterium taklimakanense]MCG7281734.1 nucleotidyltransferase domain-containing protein [Chryseobacterium taklimakanense]
MKRLNINIHDLKALCQQHSVDQLYLFGSVLNKNFTDESDIDFLVKFLPIDLFHYFENYLSVKENLERLTGRNVDLVEVQTLKNTVLIDSINKNKELIYG